MEHAPASLGMEALSYHRSKAIIITEDYYCGLVCGQKRLKVCEVDAVVEHAPKSVNIPLGIG